MVRSSLVVLVLFASLSFFALSQPMQDNRNNGIPSPLEFVGEVSEQVTRGAEVYDLVCSDCHGDTGLGIEEGRLSFLPEHQRCEKCHKAFNAKTKRDVEISERNSFNLGNPPALRGANILEHFGNAAVLYTYIRAAMPRYDPGALSEQDYLDITAFLLELNNKLPRNTNLTRDNISNIHF